MIRQKRGPTLFETIDRLQPDQILRLMAQFRADPLRVDSFSLIASFQTKSGSVYEDQADYPLLY